MSNTLTNLIPTIYEAADIVSRELVGFIPSVYLNASAQRAAKSQTIRYPIVAAETAADITPAATGPDPSANTVGSGTMSIDYSRAVTFFFEGEEQLGLGDLYQTILRDEFAQAMRVLVNEVEDDLADLYVYSSRAYGTAGTTPFGSNLGEAAQVRKILADNGAPLTDLQMVIDTAAGASLRTLAQLTKANEAGTTQLREQGVLLDIHGFKIRESAQIAAHTKGTASGYKVDLTAGYAAASTTVHVDTGTGTMLAGDILTNSMSGRDSNKYVIATGHSGDGDQNVVVAAPGLKKAWVNNDDVAVGNSYTPNMVFHRQAIHALLRVPAKPEGGDSADEEMVVTDPKSGISFLVSMYRQYHRIAYEVGLAWGVKAVKPEHIAILIG